MRKEVISGQSAAGCALPNLLTRFLCPLTVHAAVLAINEAVERGVVEDTLAALQNPSALLGNLREPLAAIYQELLAQAKAEKAANARNHVRKSLGAQQLKKWNGWACLKRSPGFLSVPFQDSEVVSWRN